MNGSVHRQFLLLKLARAVRCLGRKVVQLAIKIEEKMKRKALNVFPEFNKD